RGSEEPSVASTQAPSPDTRLPPTSTVPQPQTSPARSEVPTMAKTRLQDSADGPTPPEPAKKPPDPRTALPTPVHGPTAGAPGAPAPPPNQNDPPPTPSALWRRLRRNLLFWKAPTDLVQASVFGPVGLMPGGTARVCVVLHLPEAADNVRTMVRAF